MGCWNTDELREIQPRGNCFTTLCWLIFNRIAIDSSGICFQVRDIGAALVESALEK